MATQQTISTVNGIDLDVLHETVSAIENDPALAKCKFRANNKWINGNHNRTRITGFYGAKQEMTHQQSFELHADEPPVLAGDTLYLCREEGDVYVCRVKDDGLTVLNQTKFDDVFVASPVLLRNRLLLRGEKHLWCIGK